jgi:hypothetical protein
VSTDFLLSCLGPRAKYSCALYPTGKENLEEAEVLMMESYCQKARLEDGMDILDLGCGACISLSVTASDSRDSYDHTSRLGVTIPLFGAGAYSLLCLELHFSVAKGRFIQEIP